MVQTLHQATFIDDILRYDCRYLKLETVIYARRHQTERQRDVEVEIGIQIHTLIHLSARLNSDSVNFRGLIAGNPCEIRNVLPIAIFISSASKPLKNPCVPTIIGKRNFQFDTSICHKTSRITKNLVLIIF